MNLYNIITGVKKNNTLRVFNSDNIKLKNKKSDNVITKLKKRKLKVKNIGKFDQMDVAEEKEYDSDEELKEAISTANRDAFIGEFGNFEPVKAVSDKIEKITNDIKQDEDNIVE